MFSLSGHERCETFPPPIETVGNTDSALSKPRESKLFLLSLSSIEMADSDNLQENLAKENKEFQEN